MFPYRAMNEDFRLLFPKMPHEVFEVWLYPLLYFYRLEVSADTARAFSDVSWKEKFADKTFEEWSKFSWERRSFPCDLALLHPQSVQRALWIMRGACLGEHTPTANVRDTDDRFWACAALVRGKPSDYVPLVCIEDQGLLSVVDGNHRLAAIIALRLEILGITLETWIGTPSDVYPCDGANVGPAYAPL